MSPNEVPIAAPIAAPIVAPIAAPIVAPSASPIATPTVASVHYVTITAHIFNRVALPVLVRYNVCHAIFTKYKFQHIPCHTMTPLILRDPL